MTNVSNVQGNDLYQNYKQFLTTRCEVHEYATSGQRTEEADVENKTKEELAGCGFDMLQNVDEDNIKSLDEFNEAVNNAAHNMATSAMQEFDTDGTKGLSYEEFAAYENSTNPEGHEISKEEEQAVKEMYDYLSSIANDDGIIDTEELADYYVFQDEADGCKDGYISIDYDLPEVKGTNGKLADLIKIKQNMNRQFDRNTKLQWLLGQEIRQSEHELANFLNAMEEPIKESTMRPE